MNATILLLRKQKFRKPILDKLDSSNDGKRFQTNQNYIQYFSIQEIN